MGYDNVAWINLALDEENKYSGSIKLGEFLNLLNDRQLSGRTLLHALS
jgi:hypothetical protein